MLLKYFIDAVTLSSWIEDLSRKVDGLKKNQTGRLSMDIMHVLNDLFLPVFSVLGESSNDQEDDLAKRRVIDCH